jgi:hypothetical protein
MKRTPVASTSIISVGYDKAKKVLEIEFATGKVYDYFNVPIKKYLSLIQADSKGKFVNFYIKGFHDYKQVA